MGNLPRNNPVYERWRLQIFGITWLGYAGLYLTRKAFSVAKVGLLENGILSTERMSYIDGGYLMAYAVGQFCWGILGDKFGTRVIILGGLLISSLTAVAMGFSDHWYLLFVFNIVQGLCQSTGWAPLAKNVSEFFSMPERGVVMGWWCTNYAVGGAVASPFAGYMADLFDNNWRFAFFSPAVALLVVWVLFIFFQKNKPEDVGLPPIEQYHGVPEAVLSAGERPEEEKEGTWKVIGEVFRNRNVQMMGLAYFCLKPTRYAVLFWAPMYVHEKLGTGMGQSGLLSVMFEIAGPFGVLSAGYISDKLFQCRRLPISAISLFALAILLYFFDQIALTGGAITIGALLFGVGFLLYGPDSLISGTAAIDFGTKKGASTSSGFINGCGSIGAVAGGTLPGLVRESWGWEGIFLFLSISIFLAGVISCFWWNVLPLTANNNASGDDTPDGLENA